MLKSLCLLFCTIPVMYLYKESFHSALIIPFLYLTAKQNEYEYGFVYKYLAY